MKNQAALGAAALKKEVKAAFPGLKFSCTSSVYSMGSSIRLEMNDQPPEISKAIQSLAAKYQYGHFNGMDDIYEITNSREDLPQAKYVFVTNNASMTKKQEIYEGIRQNWAGGQDLPPTYEEGCGAIFQGRNVQEMVWRQFTGAEAA